MSTPLAATYAHQLADRFRREILSGRLAPGQRLREAPLAERYGISRGPIRDTFVRLTQEGLLEARPNAGVRVAAPPSPFKRRTLVRLRRTIEADALRGWFRHRDAALLDDLADNLRQYKPACRRGEMEQVVAVDMAFHRAIVAAADGGSLLDTWLPVTAQMCLRYSRHRSLLESHAEHAAIVDAVRAGDRAAAVRLLRAHIV